MTRSSATIGSLEPARWPLWPAAGSCPFCSWRSLAAMAVTFVPGLLGYQRYVLVGHSMEPTIHRGSLVFDEIVNVSDLRKGDVITYVPPGNAEPVTHRLISRKHGKKGGPVFRTKGDNNAVADPRTFQLDKPRQARYAFSVPYLGWLFIALGNAQDAVHPARDTGAVDRALHARRALARGRPAGRPARGGMRCAGMGQPSQPSSCCSLIAGVASALPTDPKLGRISAQGPVGLSSSKASVALLQGTGIKPGDSVTGIVTLTNKGDRPASSRSRSPACTTRPASTAAASRASCSCASTTSPPAARRSRRRSRPHHAVAARRPQGPPVPHLQGHRDVPRHRPAARPGPGRQRPAGLERRDRAGLEPQREGPGRAEAADPVRAHPARPPRRCPRAASRPGW